MLPLLRIELRLAAIPDRAAARHAILNQRGKIDAECSAATAKTGEESEGTQGTVAYCKIENDPGGKGC